MKRVILVTSEFLGKGDDELGDMLMNSFLNKVWGTAKEVECMVFYNSGVKPKSYS